mgnify:CR=1 FL=1
MTDTAYERIRVDRPLEGVARVTLARPEAANAQDRRMLYEINDALDRASRDGTVKVIVVAADGVRRRSNSRSTGLRRGRLSSGPRRVASLGAVPPRLG